MKAGIWITSVVAVLMATATIGLAQYDIAWWTIDGGGGTSSGGAFSIGGTIGRPEAGTLTGGNFTLSGGWGGIIGVSSPGAPALRIQQSNNRVVTISWPKPAMGWRLEQTVSFQPPVSWTEVSSALLQTNATDIYVVISPPAGPCYYRLRRP